MSRDEASQSLRDSYYRARKAYVVASFLLAAWELIGIEVGEVSAVDLGLAIQLESPGAVPYALIAVICYLGYRLFVEWQQCNTAQKGLRFAKLDYRFSHLLAILSILLYLYQAISNMQLADNVNLDKPVVALIATYAGIVVANMIISLVEAWSTDRRAAWGIIMILGLIVSGGVILSTVWPKFGFVASAVAVGSGLFKIFRYRMGWTEERIHGGKERTPSRQSS